MRNSRSIVAAAMLVLAPPMSPALAQVALDGPADPLDLETEPGTLGADDTDLVPPPRPGLSDDPIDGVAPLGAEDDPLLDVPGVETGLPD